jgi:glucose-1-phosphate thymidylyltransferase
MRVIILLGGYGTRMRPHTWSRPKPILNVAGNSVLGHILDNLSAVTTEEVIFVVGYLGDKIEAWVRRHYPHLNAHFIVQEEALGQAHAVWLCRQFLDKGEVVVAFGDGIIKAEYEHLRTDADATFLVQEIDDPRSFGIVKVDEAGFVTAFVEKPDTKEHKQAVVGINWFRSAPQLRDAIDRVMAEDRRTKGEYFMADAYQVLLEEGARIRTMDVEYWFDAGKPGNILDTNRRLLSLEHASADALERSFSEGFLVVPPVYLHPDSDVEGSVVGPYASIGPGVTLRSSVVRNSIVDAGARIENGILDGSLIGENAVVRGQAIAAFIGDNARIESGPPNEEK